MDRSCLPRASTSPSTSFREHWAYCARVWTGRPERATPGATFVVRASAQSLRPCGRAASLEDLEEAGAALAAAYAHGHDAPLGAAALAFLQDMAGAAGPGHAER